LNNKIEIFKTADNQAELRVQFDEDTVWLNRQQLAMLFERDVKTIGKHINNVFNEGELHKNEVVANFATTTQHGAIKGKTQIHNVEHYNLDVIISVGYRVKSHRGTQFRQWATKRLKDYLEQGYAINEKRLEQKQQEIKQLKGGIQILSRVIEEQKNSDVGELLSIFTKGLNLLDDYDHETLDLKGNTKQNAYFPSLNEYLSFISQMYSSFESSVFAKPKDNSFESSIHQIEQTFDGHELYPSLQEKAANLLYFIVKNHSFVDGNKRIAAACFIYFLDKNKALMNKNNGLSIGNDALAALTLFIATSQPQEADIVKRFIISILNRNEDNL